MDDDGEVCSNVIEVGLVNLNTYNEDDDYDYNDSIND